jgi:hypothetical protein
LKLVLYVYSLVYLLIPNLDLRYTTSNIEILERLQSKALRMIVGAPWYVPNADIRRDLQKTTVKEEIRRYSSQYSALLSAHPNGLVVNVTATRQQAIAETPAK